MTHRRHAHGPLVRVLRQAKRMPLIQVSTVTGLSVSYLSRIERGERTATWDNTVEIARALFLPPAFLTGQWPPFRPLRMLVHDGPFEEFARSVGLDGLGLTRLELGSDVPSEETLALFEQRLGVPVAVLRPLALSHSDTPLPASTE